MEYEVMGCCAEYVVLILCPLMLYSCFLLCALLVISGTRTWWSWNALFTLHTACTVKYKFMCSALWIWIWETSLSYLPPTHKTNILRPSAL
jgi:hypothetical protein